MANDVKKTGVEPATIPTQPRAAPGAKREATIQQLESAYPEWGEDGWQLRALWALDNGDKKISVREIARAQKRTGTKVVTSVEIDDTAEAVGVQLAKRGAVSTRQLRDRTKEIATLADAVGNRDGKTTADEVIAFGKQLAAGKGPPDLYYLTNQRLLMLKDAVARLTGEPVPTDLVVRAGDAGVELLYPAMYVLYDGHTNVAKVAVTAYFSEDAKLAPATERADRFYKEPALAERDMGVEPKVFSGSFKFTDWVWQSLRPWQFHKGHLLANLDFAAEADQRSSFVTANMHAQTGASNSVVWLRKVEMPIRDETLANGSRVMMATGPLFVDRDLEPLAPGAMRWIAGKDGAGSEQQLEDKGVKEMVAVPTHTFKVVLEQSAQGEYSVRCYLVENRMDLPSTSTPKRVEGGMPAIAAQLAKEGSAILSLSEIEQLTGLRLFNDLPAEVRAAIADHPEKKVKPRKKQEFIAKLDEGFRIYDRV